MFASCRLQGPGSTLPLQVQMRCILQIIDGVKHAHGKDLYNCDLKLENILMRADGSLVVADWGLTVRNNQALAAFTCASVSPFLHHRRMKVDFLSQALRKGVIPTRADAPKQGRTAMMGKVLGARCL